MDLSVVLSTYNQPEWLRKVLHGYAAQTLPDFEIVIADDGSGEETAEVIEAFRASSKRPVRHVWQEDEGFQKSRILNKATVAASGEYLVYSDGDCIPRADFLEVHSRLAERGKFLSGGYCKLPMNLSRAITTEDILSGRVFDVGWLRRHGMSGFSQMFKIGLPVGMGPLMDLISPTKASWNGHNASGWKSDILAVNGYNEEMQYGGQDRELGERMRNNGITGKRIRHRALVVHLDHKRGYNTPETIRKNLAIREEVAASRSVWCANGIRKSPQP